MEKQIQQLQGEVQSLKVRLFDANEALTAERGGINQIMQQLVQVAKVKGDENGNVTIDSILARVQTLVTLEEGEAAVELGLDPEVTTVIADEM
jgi:hypothetical protein